jgi:hypothetical protein
MEAMATKRVLVAQSVETTNNLVKIFEWFKIIIFSECLQIFSIRIIYFFFLILLIIIRFNLEDLHRRRLHYLN